MASKKYTVFSTITRAQLCVRSKPISDWPPCVSEDEVYREGVYGKEYILSDDQEVILAPKSAITLIGTKLENLPIPTKVTITGNGATFRRTITDGTYEFSINVPGEYAIKCESRVELPIDFKVNIP